MNDNLLDSIVRCDEISKSHIDPTHACAKIVSVQRGLGGGNAYQVPEPWRGDIRSAPLLFISSNPSIDLLDDAPWNTQPTKEIAIYYDGPDKKISKHFPHSTYRYGPQSRNPVKFWKSVHQLAVELYGLDFELTSGKHYAITEVVHCKSQREYGVREALACCSDKYLGKILENSECQFIVSLGDHAEFSLKRLSAAKNQLPKILFLAHPSSWGSDKADPSSSTASVEKKVKRITKARTVAAAIKRGQY